VRVAGAARRGIVALRRGFRLVTFALVCSAVAVTAQSCTEGSEDGADSPDARSDSPLPDSSAGESEGNADAPPNGEPVPDAAYLDAGSPCEDAATPCAPGFACCTPCCRNGAVAVCTPAVATDKGNVCPLPNLSVNEGALIQGMYLETVEAGACELQEECLSGPGARRVLRFDVRIRNHGAADLVLGAPDASDGFVYAPCHMHYHFEEFAKYTLLDSSGNVVVVGRKQAFCARDSFRFDLTAQPQARYDCGSQGISRGWEDIYAATLPCQWLDVTDIPAGNYRLEVEVNPTRAITELRYDDNRASIPVTLP
jgi:hypothetical protein